MFIVEGPDGAGKTTLIGQLSDRYHMPIAGRVVAKDTTTMTDLKLWTQQNLKRGFQNVLFDRHRLISHFIYAPIMGRPLGPGFDDMAWLNWAFMEFYSIKPVIIYCLPPKALVLENVSRGEDNLAVQTIMPRVYDAYHAKAAYDLATFDGGVYLWNYTQEWSLAKFDGIVNKYLEEH